jgi:hypothetical protein
MIFARKSDAALASLVKRLDEMVAKHSDKKLSAFVNLIGADGEKLQEAAKEFAADNKVANIPVVVPVEAENGPADFGINPDAEVTVMLYTGLKVQANHAFRAGKFDKKSVAAINMMCRSCWKNDRRRRRCNPSLQMFCYVPHAGRG